MSPYGCVTCVCVWYRDCAGAAHLALICLGLETNGRGVMDEMGFCLFILKTGEILLLCKVCVCVCAVEKKRGELKRIKKKPVATQSNSIGTPSSYSVFSSSTTKLSAGPRQGFPKTKNSLYRIKGTIIQRLGNASI